MRRDKLPAIPLRVDIDTNRSPRPSQGYMNYEVRQDDIMVEFYQDGRHIYTASSGEVFGHEYFLQILEDVINAAMLLKEGRVEEAELIGKRFQTAFWINRDNPGDDDHPEEGGESD